MGKYGTELGLAPQRGIMKPLIWRSSGLFFAACAVLGVGIGFAIDTHMTGNSIMTVTNLISVLGTTFAAFCVWLSVRIVNKREVWAKRTAIWLAVVLPPLYVLSSGPLIPLAFHTSSEMVPTAKHVSGQDDGQYTRLTMIVGSEWYNQIYWPLRGMSRQFWGGPLRWYWELFPIPDESMPPIPDE